MMKSWLLVSMGLAALAHAAEIKKIDVGANPESVTRGFDSKIFVTLMGPSRTPGDGDGGIVKIEGGKAKPFAGGMNDPKGLVFLPPYLITADFDQVWKVDVKGNKTLLAGPEKFPNPVLFLNDVALAPDGKSVFVTDMGARDKLAGPDGAFWPLDSPEAKAVPAQGRVYQITLEGKVTEVIAPDERMKCPNGVDAVAGGKIRIAEFFTGTIYEWNKGAWTTLAEGHRSADAIVHDEKGNFYVTEVKTGNVWKYAALTKAGPKDAQGQPTVIVTGYKRRMMSEGLGLTSAADAYVDDGPGFLIVPETKAGQLVFLPLTN